METGHSHFSVKATPQTQLDYAKPASIDRLACRVNQSIGQIDGICKSEVNTVGRLEENKMSDRWDCENIENFKDDN